VVRVGAGSEVQRAAERRVHGHRGLPPPPDPRAGHHVGYRDERTLVVEPHLEDVDRQRHGLVAREPFRRWGTERPVEVAAGEPDDGPLVGGRAEPGALLVVTSDRGTLRPPAGRPPRLAAPDRHAAPAISDDAATTPRTTASAARPAFTRVPCVGATSSIWRRRSARTLMFRTKSPADRSSSRTSSKSSPRAHW